MNQYQDDSTYTEEEVVGLHRMATTALQGARKARLKQRLYHIALWWERVSIVIYAVSIGFHIHAGNGTTAALFGMFAVICVVLTIDTKERMRQAEATAISNDAMHGIVMAQIKVDTAYREAMAAAGPMEDDDPLEDEQYTEEGL